MGKVAVASEDEGRYVAPEDEGKYEEESAVEGEEEEEAMKVGEVEGDEACAVPTAGAFYQHNTCFRGHPKVLNFASLSPRFFFPCLSEQ
jgi:hypothetical protein